jgi:hypothetical protein
MVEREIKPYLGDGNTMKTELWFGRTERLLTFLWISKGRIQRLESLEKLLLDNLHCLENSLNDLRRIPGLTAKYGLVGGLARGGDYDYAVLMTEYEDQVDAITRQMIQKYRRLVSIRYRLHNLREQIAPLEAALRRATAEEQLILEQKFVFRNSNYHIADLLHCSEKRVRYIYKKIIYQVADNLGNIRAEQKQSGLIDGRTVAL